MSLEEQMRQMEAGAMPAPAGGMTLEEQMRQMEAEAMGPSPSPVVQQEPEPSYPDEEAVSFNEHLRDLVMEIPGGIAGSIAAYDGIGIASFSTDPDFQMTIAEAEFASIMGAMRKAATSLFSGEPQEAYFVAEKLGFVVKTIRSQYFVTLVVEASELNWGLTRLHLKKIIPLIEKELF
jgi:predicted regulator of Ras-like GTPase activity (Roadblock/LC7/MglB family)